MSLTSLIQKGGLESIATVTDATSMTEAKDKDSSVIPVTAVTVIKTTETDDVLPHLLTEEEQRIRNWFDFIGESDNEVIEDYLYKCRKDSTALRYFLDRANECPSPTILSTKGTCGKCIHFTRTNHPNIGHCIKGEPEAVVGIWDTDERNCQLRETVNSS